MKFSGLTGYLSAAGWGSLLVGLGAVLALLWLDHREDELESSRPIKAPVTDQFLDFDRVEIPFPVDVPVIPEEDLQQLREDYDRPDLSSVEGQGPAGGLSSPEGGEDYVNVSLPIREFEITAKLRPGDTALLVKEPGNELSLTFDRKPRGLIGRAENQFSLDALIPRDAFKGDLDGSVAIAAWSPLRVGECDVGAGVAYVHGLEDPITPGLYLGCRW